MLETEFPSLAEFETQTPKLFGNEAWQSWYSKFTSLVDGGRREIFRVVE